MLEGTLPAPIMLGRTSRGCSEGPIEHDRRNKGTGAGQTLAPQLVMSLELKLAQAKPSSTIT